MQLAHHILIGDKAILKNKLGIDRKSFAHLVVHAPDGETLTSPLEQEQSAAFGKRLVLVGLYKYQKKTRHAAVGNEVFHAIHNPSAIDFFGGRSK